MGQLEIALKLSFGFLVMTTVGCTNIQQCSPTLAIANLKEVIKQEEIGIELATWEFQVEDRIEQYEIFARAPNSLDPEFVLIGRVNKKTCAARTEPDPM